MKKIFIGLATAMILLVVVGIFTSATDFEIEEGARTYVENFIEKRGIESESIKNVSKVDFDDLPKEVNIENVNDANLAIYQIDYEEDQKEEQVFVISYSVEELRAQGDLIVAHDKRQFLSFGYAGEMSESGFLKTDTDVGTSLEKGYVMMRQGSITGISTNLEAVEGEGKIEIIIYKNGKLISFGNTFIVDSPGIKKDYDVQSNDIVTFEPGDVISAYVNAEENIVWKDVITMIEITTIN